jgi:hypothetical protein
VTVERVSQSTAVRHWLRTEVEKDDRSPDVTALSGREALDELLDRKPGAAAFVWRDAPVRWYRLDLTATEFAALEVVEGPPDLGWRALSPDGTVRGAARRIDREDPAGLAAETGVDVSKVLSLAASPPDATDRVLVLATREGCVPWTVADGNHRAVATALSLRTGASYHPQPAYLGVGTNRVVSPLRERLCGVARRVVSVLSAPFGRDRERRW